MAGEAVSASNALKLFGQPGLAETGFTTHVDDATSTNIEAGRNCGSKLPKFAQPSHECAIFHRRATKSQEPPGTHRRGKALHVDIAHRFAIQPIAQFTKHGSGQEYLAAARMIGQTRRKVYALAGYGIGPVPRASHLARQDLAACEAHMHLDVPTETLIERRDRITNAQCRHDGAFGIIAMCHGSAEHGHHAITDMLVDAAAVLDDRSIGNFEKCREDAFNLLSVEQPAEFGISGEVGEQDRHLPALAWAG